MPELPEVETTCRGIYSALVGQKVSKIIIRETRLRWPIDTKAIQRVKNQAILNVTRRAKYILIEFAEGTMVIHLGMSGSLRLGTADTPIKKHDHIEWHLSSSVVLRYHDPRRFGAVLWSKDPEQLPQFKHLGPEPLDPTFTAKHLYLKTQKAKSPIKSIIMNQRIVVGVGNIYAVEGLYVAKIHPLRLGNTLSLAECKALCSAIKQVLKKSIQAGGTTLQDFYQSDGQPGYFAQKLQVYDEHRKPCRTCKTLIEKIVIQNRSTYFCPKCQT
jgi:formamidopyrimidine-DNA glycosylase